MQGTSAYSLRMGHGDAELVVAAYGRQVRLHGQASLFTVPVETHPLPVVGDRVEVDLLRERVEGVLPRRSLLRRADPGGGEQSLAANVDLVLIVCGLDRPVKTGRIQRAAALAWDCGATPLVVLTKADLSPEPVAQLERTAHENPGMEVLAISEVDDSLIEVLRDRLGMATCVLLGESGAGKSTLVNALLGKAVTASGEVRAGDAKGRHTTSERELFVTPQGGSIIDTPGIRAVGLPADLTLHAEQFEDITHRAESCRFRDCVHDAEPGCAVQEAIGSGVLPAVRLDQWHRLRREIVGAQVRADPQERRAAERTQAKLYRQVQSAKHRERP